VKINKNPGFYITISIRKQNDESLMEQIVDHTITLLTRTGSREAFLGHLANSLHIRSFCRKPMNTFWHQPENEGGLAMRKIFVTV